MKMQNLKLQKPKTTQAILAYFDGACEPVNPGGTASFGAVVFNRGEKIWECGELFHPEKGREHETSNNLAEYLGFLAILEFLFENGLNEEQITICGDSRLVILQMFGHWKIKGGFYAPFAAKAKALLAQHFPSTTGYWVPRDRNSIADKLSKTPLIEAGVPITTH
jgi:ribonuclease HI